MSTNNSKQIIFKAEPAEALTGQLRVPGDKSISHRSIMLGSLADGVTVVTGFLEGEDSLATLRAFQSMGVTIEGPTDGKVTIHGVGIDGLHAPAHELDLGNSGTSMRLMTGLLSGQQFSSVLIGDESLSGRPMRRVTDPLAQMGAIIGTTEQGTAPLHIAAEQTLKGVHYGLPVASAQIKSCLLLAGLYAKGETCVTEPAPTRDHTERMLRGFGYPVEVNDRTACVTGGHRLTATNIDVPADISSAGFFMVAASIASGSDITLLHVGINPTRIGVINILRQMGANIEITNKREVGGEPVADIRVQSAQLRGIHIPEDQVPLAIDEFPVLFVAAACAEGKTVLTGARELRVKESDRIQVMADGLQALGVDAQPTEDGMIIIGKGSGNGDDSDDSSGPNTAVMSGGTVKSHGDHRIAMSFAIASLRASTTINIQDCANVNTSFPGFVDLASAVGLNISSHQA